MTCQNVILAFASSVFVPQEDVGVIRQVDPTTKEVTYNPRYEEMFSPEVKKCTAQYIT